MDYILNKIERSIKTISEDCDNSIAINIHQVWFLYVILLHLAIFYNSHPESVKKNLKTILTNLEKPALGSLLSICKIIGGNYSFSNSGDILKNCIEAHLGEFVKTRNSRIGHAFHCIPEEFQKTLRELKKTITQITYALHNSTENGVESFLGNNCDIICVTSKEGDFYNGVLYSPTSTKPSPWTSNPFESFKCGETYLSINLKGEKNTLRLSPFIHIDPLTNSIYLFRTIAKEYTGRSLYYKILEFDPENFELIWDELASFSTFGKRESYQTHERDQIRQEIIVDPNGHGHAKTINEALALSGDFTKIIIKPGNYQENIHIDKQVYLYGEDGDLGVPTIWCTSEKTCVKVESTACLHNLRITSTDQQQEVIAIDASGEVTLKKIEIYNLKGCGASIQGNALIEECLIHSIHGDGIKIKPQSNPIIRECTFKNVNHSGVTTDSKNGLLEKCNFYNCSKLSFDYGTILLNPSTKIHIKKCNFYDSATVICTKETGTLHFSDSTIKDCLYPVICKSKSNINMANCTFENNKESIHLDHCSGTFIHCKFLNSLALNILNCDESKLWIQYCDFIDSHAQGILLEKCKCQIDYSNFLRIKNIVINAYSSDCDINESSFQNNFIGIEIKNCEDVLISNSNFSQSRLNTICIDNCKNFLIHNCSLQGSNSEASAYLIYKSTGSIQCNDISYFSTGGLSISELSNIRIASCKIHDCKLPCIIVSNESKSTIEDNFFSKNIDQEEFSAGTIMLSKNSSAKISFCKFKDTGTISIDCLESTIIAEQNLFNNSSKEAIAFNNHSQGYIEECRFCSVEAPICTVNNSNKPTLLNCFTASPLGRKKQTIIIGDQEWLVMKSNSSDATLSRRQLTRNLPTGWSIPDLNDLITLNNYVKDNHLHSTSMKVPLNDIINTKNWFWLSNGNGIIRATAAKINDSNQEFQKKKFSKKEKLTAVLLRKNRIVNEN